MRQSRLTKVLSNLRRVARQQKAGGVTAGPLVRRSAQHNHDAAIGVLAERRSRTRAGRGEAGTPVPRSLVRTTVKAALALAGGRKTGISKSVLFLLEDASKETFRNRRKTAAI